MNTDEMTDRLRALPPPLVADPDRFASVERRVRRRARNVNAAIAGTVAAVAVVVTTAVLAGTSPTTQSDSHRIATEPPSPSRTDDVTYEDPGPLPGSTTAIDLGDPVEVEATGTSTVDLGARPDRATAVQATVMCTTPGRIELPDGGSMVCDDPPTEDELADPRSGAHMVVDLEPGQTTLTFTARAGVGWKVVATYVRTETSDWGVNAKGETYGVQRNGRSPDLLAVMTTDGRQGYAYVTDLDGQVPPASPAEALAHQEALEGRTRSVPVYESDGETVIGELTIG